MENTENKTIENSVNENLSNTLDNMVETFYKIERKNDDGDILKADISKTTSLEIGYLVISTLENMTRDLILLYCNTTKKKEEELTIEILKVMKILTSKPTIDEEITEQLKNIDNIIIKIAVIYVFIETWNNKMIEEGKSIVIKKDSYLEMLKEEIKKKKEL